GVAYNHPACLIAYALSAPVKKPPEGGSGVRGCLGGSLHLLPAPARLRGHIHGSSRPATPARTNVVVLEVFGAEFRQPRGRLLLAGLLAGSIEAGVFRVVGHEPARVESTEVVVDFEGIVSKGIGG